MCPVSQDSAEALVRWCGKIATIFYVLTK